MKDDAIIIILSFPDTVVRPAYTEFSSKIWPLIGVGGKHAVQAGHAALLLIKKNESEINYFDFGRYITSYGNGRVRSKETDPELKVSIEAKFKNNELINLKEILLWIEKHPEKTHGEGRLVATINSKINYKKAQHFINAQINNKEIPYGAFKKNATNCARFVTDTLIASSIQKSIIHQLKTSNLFTPSPVGNVIKGTTTDKIYEVNNNQIKEYTNRSILKEYKNCFLKKIDRKPDLIGTELPDLEKYQSNKGTWLGGIGSGAWFIIEKQIKRSEYLIKRQSVCGSEEFENIYFLENDQLDLDKSFRFLYPSNYQEITIQQDNKIFSLRSKQNT